MKVSFFFLCYLLSISFVFSQNTIDWKPDYKLKISDFQASGKVGDGSIYTVYAACSIGFAYQMNSYQFMFSKNFNSKVSTNFLKSASYITAVDTITKEKLLKFAQVEFDLSELYSRKFRKLMFENKNVFSDPNFYKKLYDQVQTEMALRNSQLAQDTNMGMAELRLKEQHEKILAEIKELSEFCKECKPKKKKLAENL
jgi:16S rRNA G966 N2-methylase RsmD